MILLGLRAIGTKTVYITDVSESRRKKAQEMGATGVANPMETKIPSWIKELTQGKGVDAAIEAVGIEATLKDCLTSIRFKGKVIVQGIFTDRVPIHMLGFVTRETTMIGTNSVNPRLAMKWIEEKGARPEAIVLHCLPAHRGDRLEQSVFHFNSHAHPLRNRRGGDGRTLHHRPRFSPSCCG